MSESEVSYESPTRYDESRVHPAAEPGPAFQGSEVPCDDRITFPVAFPSESFFLDGQELTLEILGFQSGGGRLRFRHAGGLASRAELIGRITQVPGEAPEPASLSLLAGGAALLLLRRYRREGDT